MHNICVVKLQTERAIKSSETYRFPKSSRQNVKGHQNVLSGWKWKVSKQRGLFYQRLSPLSRLTVQICSLYSASDWFGVVSYSFFNPNIRLDILFYYLIFMCPTHIKESTSVFANRFDPISRIFFPCLLMFNSKFSRIVRKISDLRSYFGTIAHKRILEYFVITIH